MFRNYLSAALGDLFRSPLQSLITIGGLAIGLAAAILAGLVVANQFSYDHFVPGYQRLYMASIYSPGPSRTIYGRSTPHDLAGELRQGFSGIEEATRFTLAPIVIRHDDIHAREEVYWADPNFFHMMPLRVLYGNLDGALARPDSIVIPLETARKYFGRGDVMGQTVTLDHHPMTVTAVIADLPPNASTLQGGIFASSLAPFSTMTKNAGRAGMTMDGLIFSDVFTLVRLAPGASLEKLNRDASAFVARYVPKSLPYSRAMMFIPLDRFHLSPQLFPGVLTRLIILATVAILTLFLACVNFVNLSTARSMRRALEVGIRKASGASRSTLVVQFLGEAILQVLLALCVAVMLVEWTLPAVNAFLQSGAVFDYWRNPALIGILLLGVPLVGILAGAYPALILSAFGPTAVLKGLMRGSAGTALVRQALVTLQFGILIVLMVAATVVFRQERYATQDALRVNTDQMLFVRTDSCGASLRDEAASLPGVIGAACSGQTVLPNLIMNLPAVRRDGGSIALTMDSVGFGFFELYGLKPLAGRFFARGQGGDEIPDNPSPDTQANYVINQAAVRQLGLGSPEAAIGKTISFISASQAYGLLPGPTPGLRGTVIGVVRDFSVAPTDTAIEPIAYSVGQAVITNKPQAGLLHVKLRGVAIPDALAALDALWQRAGNGDPIDRTFVDAYVQKQEIAVLREAVAFAVFAGVAMFLACLGLFGVSLSTTERRTKEIGIRKAMGATSSDILALLLWQFSKPVLWANLIAWPLAWWLMHYWLAGFAYHVSLDVWPFLAAGTATLAIALLTVAGQATMVARQKPVQALRYE